jgi:hypothetical protein
MANTIVLTSQPNNVVTVSQKNVVPVTVDQGSITSGNAPPYVVREDVGIIGGLTDMFVTGSPSPADILLFDPTLSKYKNIALSGAISVNTTGVSTLNSIDGGTF